MNELDMCLAVDAPPVVVDRALSNLTLAVERHFAHEEAEWWSGVDAGEGVLVH